MVIVGFGSIGQGVLPLILRHIGIRPDRITIVTAEEPASRKPARSACASSSSRWCARISGACSMRLMGRGDFLLNLSVDVSSIALVKHCWERGVMYLDTCIEPWAGRLHRRRAACGAAHELCAARRGAALRTDATANAPTAVITHGANPGLVSHFVKVALLLMRYGPDKLEFDEPKTRTEWAKLAQTVGVSIIHIAERDTQVPSVPKQLNEFVNTWSVDGFVGEGCSRRNSAGARTSAISRATASV